MRQNNILDRRIYVMSDVDRYVGLASGTARRWIDGYSRGGRVYPPVIRESTSGDDAASWGEFVETSLLAGFRDRGVSLQRLRPAVQQLRDELGTLYPLAAQRTLLDVAGRELVQRVQESTGLTSELHLVVVRSGQLMLSGPTASFVERAHYDQGVVAELSLGDDAVRVNPIRAGGRPAVRSVPAEVLAEGFRAGESTGALASLYEVSIAQVEAALRYEMQAAQHAAA
jgi:uncharacterized protein (DUF433 family)